MESKKGITLIALIITIIVLLILAGVTIRLVVGENGVIKRGEKTVEETEKAKLLEDMNLAYAEIYMDKIGKEEIKEEEKELVIERVKEKLMSSYGYDEKSIKSRNEIEVTDIEIIGTAIELGIGEEKTVKVNIQTRLIEKSYALIKGKYYEIKIEGARLKLGEARNKIPEVGEVEEPEIEIEEGEEIIEAKIEQNTIKIKGKEGQKGKAKIKVRCGGKSKEIEVVVK